MKRLSGRLVEKALDFPVHRKCPKITGKLSDLSRQIRIILT